MGNLLCLLADPSSWEVSHQPHGYADTSGGPVLGFVWDQHLYLQLNAAGSEEEETCGFLIRFWISSQRAKPEQHPLIFTVTFRDNSTG